MDGLIAAAEPDPDGGVMLQDRFLNHQFDRVYSGLYYQIKPLAGGTGRADFALAVRPGARRHRQCASAARSPGAMPRARKISICACCRGGWNFPSPPRRDQTTRAPIPSWWRAIWRRWTRKARDFNGTLIWSFLLLGLGLMAAILLQVRVGLLPLRRLKDALARIRDGKARRLEGNFPAEIAPLADRTQFPDRAQRGSGGPRPHPCFQSGAFSQDAADRAGQRSRSASRGAAWPSRCSRQVVSMRRQVDHYLARARAAGIVDVLGNRTQVGAGAGRSGPRARPHPCRARHRDRCGMSARCSISAASARTWKRWLGNLIDNACKWARAPGAGARCEKTAPG